MSPELFKQHLITIQKEFNDFFKDVTPEIAGNVAVRLFKENFQNQGFFGNKWKEVQRRKSVWHRHEKVVRNTLKGAARTRNILTGKTGDLGSSIEIKSAKNGYVIVWSNIKYSAVHNDGLRSGRGIGFIMPKRQFMGNHPTLTKEIKQELERKLATLINSL